VHSGDTFTSKAISFGGTEGSHKESEAREALEQYPLNGQVEVFYNPTNPEEAVLITGTEGTRSTIVLGGCLIVLMLVIIVGLAIGALTLI
jgi:hypothetical protein